MLQASIQETFKKYKQVKPSIFKRREGRLLGAETEAGEKRKDFWRFVFKMYIKYKAICDLA